MAFSTYNSFQRNLTSFINSVSSYIFAVDASLVLYYPFSSVNSSNKTPNYASSQAVYDGSLCGTSKITTIQNKYITSIADLSLNNTAGNTANDYVISSNTITLVPSTGLSISCWFSCSGQLNTNQTLFSLPLGNTNGINITLSNMNTIYSSYVFTPDTITGLSLWLDANKSTSLTMSGTNVSQWTDLTGNTNITATNYPTYSATGCNGKPTLQFTSGNQFTNSVNTTVYNSLANFNYFIVVKIADNNAIYAPFALDNKSLSIYLSSPSPFNPVVHTTGAPWTFNNTDFLFNNVATPTNTFCIIQLSISNNGASQTFYINGSAGNTISCSFTGSSSKIIIGNSAYSDPFVGYMSEILIYTSSLTTTQRQQIEGYLAWKWGLNSSLSNTHPYYSSAP
jgi:hypothetical protein